MSSFKAMLRASALHDIGEKFDDLLENAQAEVYKLEGARQALQQAKAKLELHMSNVDKDVEEGKIHSLEVAKHQKQRIIECMGILDALAKSATIGGYSARGKVEAFQSAVKATKAEHDRQKTRASELQKVEEMENKTADDMIAAATATKEEKGRRVIGQHPGPSLKQQRTQATKEAAAPKPSKSTPAVKKKRASRKKT